MQTFEAFSDDLKTVFIVSKVVLHEGEAAPAGAFEETVSGIKVVVSEAAGHKCDRCWFVSEDAEDIGDGQHLCPRCASVTAKLG